MSFAWLFAVGISWLAAIVFIGAFEPISIGIGVAWLSGMITANLLNVIDVRGQEAQVSDAG
jgi:hypothetical protein